VPRNRAGADGAVLRAAPGSPSTTTGSGSGASSKAAKEREGDPVIAILEQCLVEVRGLDADPEAERLERRLGTLLEFVREFDHALSGVIRADTAALRNKFTVLVVETA